MQVNVANVKNSTKMFEKMLMDIHLIALWLLSVMSVC